MKLKSKFITGTVIACFLLGGMTLHAQGIYTPSSSDNNDNTASTSTSTNMSPSTGILSRDFGDGGSDGEGDPGDPSHKDPIGGGMLILSLLSGAYAVIKRNIKNKHEE